MEEKIDKTLIQDRVLTIKKNSIKLLLLFFMWPFASLITSLKYYKQSWSKIIFILFCIYFGFAFVVPENKEGSPDSARYAQALIEIHNSRLSFHSFINSLYSIETNNVDIYQPTITWVLSLVTNNVHILFAIFALVFGYFYANNLWIILNRIKQKIPFSLFIFILVFALLNPLWNINGVRMYTAAQIFIYGVLLFFINKNKKGILWAASSCLVHISFIFPVALLLLFLFLPKKPTAYFIFLMVTAIISEIDLVRLRGSLSFLPSVLQYRINYYTDSAYALSVLESSKTLSWHVKFSDYALKGVIYSLIIVTFYSDRQKLKNEDQLYTLFSLSLFMIGWANISSLVPSGGRFLTIAYILTFTFFILYISEQKVPKLVNKTKLFAIPFLIFFCIFNIRVGFDYMGISTFIGNFISALIIEDTTPIITYIK